MSLRLPIVALLAALAAGPALGGKTRLKELVAVQGVRTNELFGYGLVVGLAGTGDTEQVFFTSQSLSGMLGRLGIRVDAREIRSRNVAAVMVTARLQTFSRTGSQLDVHVSSVGNARSLVGGVLLMTPLAGADGAVYALAQGPVQVGGFDASAFGSSVRKNQPNVGRVPGGATVEKAIAPSFPAAQLTLGLRQPDATTASRIAAAIVEALGEGSARAVDPASVEVKTPAELKDDPVGLIARLEELEVDADQRARVVISERTGTVVAGEHVRLRRAAVAHGGLQISIGQSPIVSQPAPFARGGQTAVVPVATVEAKEDARGAVALPATTTVDELVKALNLLGATPRDLVSIFQALHRAGALDAELEVL